MSRSDIDDATGGPLYTLLKTLLRWQSGHAVSLPPMQAPFDRLIAPADAAEQRLMEEMGVPTRPMSFLILELRNETYRLLGDDAGGVIRTWAGLGHPASSLVRIGAGSGVHARTIQNRLDRSLNVLGPGVAARLAAEDRPASSGGVEVPVAPRSRFALFRYPGFRWLEQRAVDDDDDDDATNADSRRWRLLEELVEHVGRVVDPTNEAARQATEVLRERAERQRVRIGDGMGADNRGGSRAIANTDKQNRAVSALYPLLAIEADRLALGRVRAETRSRVTAYISPLQLPPRFEQMPPADALSRLPATATDVLDLRRPDDEALRVMLEGALRRMDTVDAWADEMILVAYTTRFPITDRATALLHDRYVIGRARRSTDRDRLRDAGNAWRRAAATAGPQWIVLSAYDLAVLASAHENYETARSYLLYAEGRLAIEWRKLTESRTGAGLAANHGRAEMLRLLNSRLAHGRTMLAMRDARELADRASRTTGTRRLDADVLRAAADALTAAVEAVDRQVRLALAPGLSHSDRFKARIVADRRIREIGDVVWRVRTAGQQVSDRAESSWADHVADISDGRLGRARRELGSGGLADSSPDPVQRALHYLLEADSQSRYGTRESVQSWADLARPDVLAAAGIPHLGRRLERVDQWLGRDSKIDVIPGYVLDKPVLPLTLAPTWRTA